MSYRDSGEDYRARLAKLTGRLAGMDAVTRNAEMQGFIGSPHSHADLLADILAALHEQSSRRD